MLIQIEAETNCAKRRGKKMLKEKMSSEEKLTMERRFYMQLPNKSDHDVPHLHGEVYVINIVSVYINVITV